VILGSDLTYNSGSWRALSETISLLLKPGGLFLYVTLGHSGFASSGEINGFLQVATTCESLKELTSSSPDWPFVKKQPSGIDDEPWSLDALVSACVTSPQEQAILDATGGAKVLVLQKPR
jgi:hypothetical protein